MHKVWLGIGGNLGDRESHISRCLLELKQVGSLEKTSKIFETKAWGIKDRPNYLNLVVLLKTPYYPFSLLKSCKAIEKKMGRTKKQKWDSRIIDIDILYFNNWYFTSPTLIIPHPYIQDRDFVLKPMADIAPLFKHPKIKESQARLLEKLKV